MAEFLAMDGYGGYVWPAYGVSFLVLAGIGLHSVRKRRAAAREIARLETIAGDRT